MPGPLPNPQRRRRNAPAVPTTSLKASGRKGRPPKVPDAYSLGDAGQAWWRWAWSLPQALAWDGGALYALARRASLEDDIAALDTVDHFDLDDLLGSDDENEIGRKLSYVIGRLKSLAGGRVGVMREMRELDNRLGLNPKAMADLRWTIVDDSETVAEKAPAAAPKRPKLASVHRIRAVDPNAIAG